MRLGCWSRPVVALLTCLFVSSCFMEEVERSEESNSVLGASMVLGKKLPNPYSVGNMRLAYQNILNNGSAFSEIDIRATHWYVRFLPSDYLAYDQLTKDTTLQLLDHPPDHEILVQGDYYHDPSIPDSQPTYQYAKVPLNYSAPAGVSFEILEELYLPHLDVSLQSINGRTNAAAEEFADALEYEAMRITGNASGQANLAETRTRSRWTPQGRIMVWDSRLNQLIPLAGAKVRARRWFDVKEAITDESGYYKMDGTFRYEANYSIVWERNKFDIRSGTFGQATLNGPKKRGEWNVNIERNRMAFHYAHVFRAAYRYYYGDIGGLERPGFKIKYAVFSKKGNHIARNLGNWSVFGTNPNILIYRYSPIDGTENDSDEMFSTTCHETAHATHLQMMNGGAVQFCQVSETIRESWAIGVEWFITQMEYKEKGISDYADATYKVPVNFPTHYGFQYWNKKRNPSMTSLFIDLVDTNNQKGQSFGRTFSEGTVADPVSGYTLAQIESGFLKKVYGIASLAEELKANKPGETTDQQIDILLKNF